MFLIIGDGFMEDFFLMQSISAFLYCDFEQTLYSRLSRVVKGQMEQLFTVKLFRHGYRSLLVGFLKVFSKLHNVIGSSIHFDL